MTTQPLPTPPTIDILDWLTASYDWALEWHLFDPTPGSNAMYTVATPAGIWYLKNAPPKVLGFDYNTFDEVAVYQKATELGWAEKNYKAFVSKQWPTGGIYWAPRYIIPGAFNPPVVTTDSSYVRMLNCVAQPPQTIGRLQTQINGPFEFNFGGDLGTLECLVLTYQWNDGAVMETNYYAKPYGQVRWETANLTPSGRYVTQQVSNFNRIVKGGFGSVDFPCVIP